ncbi:hypothetical protein JXR93_06385 [bacterium]|nr:hypothetical protein [bacterium]
MKTRFLILFLPFLLLFACSDLVSELTLEADKLEIPADGVSVSNITASILVEDQKVADGLEVTFTTDKGTFELGKTTLTKKIKTVKSKATVTLYSSLNKETAKVTATYNDKGTKQTLTDEIEIVFGNSEVGKKLSAKNFSLTCANNLGVYSQSTAVAECFVLAQDRNKNIVNIPDLKFVAESGYIEKIDGRYFYIPETNRKPSDVDPDESRAEPRRIGNDGKTKNPRDGLVTIIAYANGEEAFTDSNLNGEKDVDEFSVDITEPYVDSNDNGKYDQGEFYYDANGNNSFDEGNGDWDNDTTIFTQTKMLLTGNPFEDDFSTRFESGGNVINIETGPVPLQCGVGNSVPYTFYLVDENLNPIAANRDDQSKLTIKVSGTKVEGIDRIETLNDTTGIVFDDKWRVSYFDETQTKFSFLVKSIASATDCEKTSAQNYTIEITLITYPGKDNPEYDDRNKITKTWEFTGPIIGTGTGD